MKHYTDDTTQNGTRYVTGEDGGRLVFNTDGSVQVSWVWTAALAADYASGKRNETARFTTARKGQPPAESKALSDVLDVRRDATAFALSEDWREPAAREFLDIHKPLAWRMLHAITTGDADTLRALAEAVEMAHSVTAGSAALNVSPWREIAEAIRSAAENKQDIPTRPEVGPQGRVQRGRTPEAAGSRRAEQRGGNPELGETLP